jgi:hypothetical protein
VTWRPFELPQLSAGTLGWVSWQRCDQLWAGASRARGIPRVEVLTALDRIASKQIQELSIRRFKIPDMVEMAPQVLAQALIHERQKVDLGLQSQPLVFRIVYLLVFYCQCFRQDRVAPLDLFDLRSAVFSELCKLQLQRIQSRA